MKKFFVVIMGPTGVGKTDFVENSVEKLNFNFEIVNADLGQFYLPLSVGTAKPDLSAQKVKHHLFNTLQEPLNFTVTEFRNQLMDCMESIWKRDAIPIIVGGSSFYVKSIFFPPKELIEIKNENLFKGYKTEDLYKRLMKIDPERATEINLHDRYRIERALLIWESTGKKPSTLKPKFNSPAPCLIYFLTRDKEDLNKRINKRTKEMLKSGWIDEVKKLDQNWYEFLKQKKLIGYPEIIDYLSSEKNMEDLIEIISRNTRQYAKRQLTFWRTFAKLLMKEDPNKIFIKELLEINLSELDLKYCLDKFNEGIKKIIENYE